MTRINVTIEHETKKAYLITNGNVKGWIQKRWLRNSDNTVAEKTFNKAVSNFKEQEDAKQAAKDHANSYHTILEVTRETEKAIAIEVVLDFCDVEKYYTKLLWIPKALIKNNSVQGWFINKKLDEILDEYRENFSRYGSVLIDSVAVADYDDAYACFR